MENEKLILTVPEAAKQLGICTSRMYELARMPSFPSFRLGKRIVISRDGLREWVKRQAEESVAV